MIQLSAAGCSVEYPGFREPPVFDLASEHPCPDAAAIRQILYHTDFENMEETPGCPEAESIKSATFRQPEVKRKSKASAKMKGGENDATPSDDVKKEDLHTT